MLVRAGYALRQAEAVPFAGGDEHDRLARIAVAAKDGDAADVGGERWAVIGQGHVSGAVRKPFDSLNHFTVPTATLYSLRTGAWPLQTVLSDRPTRPLWSGPRMSFHPDTKNAAGSFSCGNVIASCAAYDRQVTARREYRSIGGACKELFLKFPSGHAAVS